MKKIYWCILIAVVLSGAVMLTSSFRYPWHTVSKQEIVKLSSRLTDLPRDDRFSEWYEERAKLNTPRTMLNDTGIGLMTLGIALVLLRLLTGFPLSDGKTPKYRWIFILVYLLVLVAQFPASIWYFGLRQTRFEYPVWGDSIVIGIFQTLMECVFFALVGLLLWWPFLAKSSFPARLFAWPKNQLRFNLIVSIGLLSFVFASLSSITYEVRDGNIGGIIMALTLSYLFLSLRAGLVTSQKERNASQ